MSSERLHNLLSFYRAILCLALFVSGLYFAMYTTRADLDAQLAASESVSIAPQETFELNFTVDYFHLKPLVSKAIKVEGLFERHDWLRETKMEIADSPVLWDRPFLMFKFSSPSGMKLESMIFDSCGAITHLQVTTVTYGGGPIIRIPEAYEADTSLESGTYRLEFLNRGNTTIHGTLYSSLAATHFSRPHFSIGVVSIIISSIYPILMVIDRKKRV